MAHSPETTQTLERTTTDIPSNELYIYDSSEGINKLAFNGRGTMPDAQVQIPQTFLEKGRAVAEGGLIALGKNLFVDKGITAENLAEVDNPNDVARRLKRDFDKGGDSSVMFMTNEGVAYRDIPEGETTIMIVRKNAETGENEFIYPSDESATGVFQLLEGDRAILSSARVNDYLTENPDATNQRLEELSKKEVPMAVATASKAAAESMLLAASERNYAQMKYREEAQARARKKAPEAAESKSSPDEEAARKEELTNVHALVSSYEAALRRIDTNAEVSATPVESTEKDASDWQRPITESYETMQNDYTPQDNESLRREQLEEYQDKIDRERGFRIIDRRAQKRAKEQAERSWQDKLADEVAASTKKYGFERDQIVSVLRSSGETESDWKLTGIVDTVDHDRNVHAVAFVEKQDEEGNVLTKRVPLKDFKSWQVDAEVEAHIAKHPGGDILHDRDDPAIQAAESYLRSLTEQIDAGRTVLSRKEFAALEKKRAEQLEKLRKLRHDTTAFTVDSEGVTERIDTIPATGAAKPEKQANKSADAEAESAEQKGFFGRIRERSNELTAKASAAVMSGLFIAGNRLAHSEKRIDESDEMYEARIAVRGGRVVFGLGAAAGLMYWSLTKDSGSEVVAITPETPVEVLAPAPESATEFIVQPEARTIEYGLGLNGWMEQAGVTSSAERDQLLANPALIQELQAANFVYYDELLPGDVKWGIKNPGTAPQAAIDIVKKYAQK